MMRNDEYILWHGVCGLEMFMENKRITSSTSQIMYLLVYLGEEVGNFSFIDGW